MYIHLFIYLFIYMLFYSFILIITCRNVLHKAHIYKTHARNMNSHKLCIKAENSLKKFTRYVF